MRSRALYVVALAAALAAAALFLSLRPGEKPAESTGTTIPATATPEKVTLLGSGATFVHPQLDAWAKEFMRRGPGVVIEYSPTGSGAGQEQFLAKLVDFACSDPPLPSGALAQARRDPRGVIQLPLVIGSVVVIYNLPGLEGRLRLSGEVLAAIYLGEIEYWDDPRIASLNSDLRLPHERIVAVHRSDSSGTTQIFTEFLRKSSRGLWPPELVGKAVEWPVDKTGRGLGGKGNQGVADLVSRTPGSIGYVEYAYAALAKLPHALIENAEGRFVDASPETMTSALRGALAKLPPRPDDDFNEFWGGVIFAPGEDSYPITSFSFLLLYKSYPPSKAEAVKRFVEFIYTEGRGLMVEGYVPVPEELASYALRAIEIIGSG
ncbi:MAG: phosphate ABC transporter substrate-binding protein PstS [Fervidicoccaceae archaeon]